MLPTAHAGASLAAALGAEPPQTHAHAAAESRDFDCLVDHYQAPLLRFLYGVVHDREQALELCQDTFLSAYRALPRVDTAAPLDAWLYTIALNHARVALRRRRLLHWVPFLSAAHDRPSAETDLASNIAGRDALRAVIAQLPVEQRAALLLHAEGFRYAEIAQVLGCSVGAVKVRIFRARHRCQELLGAQTEDNP